MSEIENNLVKTLGFWEAIAPTYTKGLLSTDTRGRINRVQYFAYSQYLFFIIVLMVLLYSLLIDAVSTYIDMAELAHSIGLEEGQMVMVLTLLGPCLFFACGFTGLIRLTVRRLHDLNQIGYKSMLIFVPLFGGLYMIYLCLMKSKDQKNEYGVTPTLTRRWSWVHILLGMVMGMLALMVRVAGALSHNINVI